MLFKVIMFILLLIIFVNTGLSQDYSEIVDYLDEGNISADELEDIINEYKNNPVILSEVTRDDILGLPISVDLKYKILVNMKQFAGVSKWSDLSKIGFSENEIAVIRLFFIIRKDDYKKYDIINFISLDNNYLNKYPLSKIKQQIVYSDRFLFTAFSNEMDQGEKSFFDSYKFAISLNVFHNRCELMAGSYRIKWGAGILFSNSLFSRFVRDGYNNIYISKSGVRQYIGYSEDHFLSGIAAKVNFRTGDILIFYSKRNLDARVNNDTVTKFITSGYHVSQGEIISKNAVAENLCGIGFNRSFNAGKCGILFGKMTYNKVIEFLCNDDDYSYISLYHRMTFDKVSYVGEVALIDKYISFIEGIKVDVNRVRIATGYRRMNPYLFSRLGRSRKYFSSYNVNEEGFLFSIMKRFEIFNISFFLDFHRRIFDSDDTWSRLDRLYIYIPVRKKVNFGLDIYRDNPSSPNESLKMRFNIHYRIVKQFLFKNIIVMKLFKQELKSTLAMLSLRYEMVNWIVYIGISEYFNKAGSMSSIVEPSVSYNIDLVNLYGNGHRFFIVFKGHINDKFELNLAYKRNLEIDRKYDIKEKNRVVFQTCYYLWDK
ncbi:MAG: hypothetical protein H0Z29_01080 [Candidatus Marinimicrobia bacterium]|nr:hypothetical protein [Candidatus Neomarinimicrobiota bacterium]